MWTQLLGLAGLATGGASAAFSNRSRKETSTSTTKRDQTPEQALAEQAFLRHQYGILSDEDMSLDRMVAAQGVNRSFASSMDLTSRALAARGIRPDSGAAGAAFGQVGLERARALSGIDLYAREALRRRREQAAAALGAFGSANFGSTTTSTGRTGGNALGAALGDVAETAGYYTALGTFGKKK